MTFSNVISFFFRTKTMMLTDRINNLSIFTDDEFLSKKSVSSTIDISDYQMIDTIKPFDHFIIKDYSVTRKWHQGCKRPLDQITEAVIHQAEEKGNVNSLQNRMLVGDRKECYKKGIGLIHFAIDEDGVIWKAGPLSRWWHHSSSGNHDRYTIGIKLIRKTERFTDRQYSSLFYVLYDYLPLFCPSYYRLISHESNRKIYGAKGVRCNRTDIDWKRIEQEVLRRNIRFNTHGQEEYAFDIRR